MKAYKCTIKLKSSVETPLEADIIWGSIIWALKYFYGKEEVEETIKEYSTEPPLIISDGFPAGYLPCPLCDIPAERIENLIESSTNMSRTIGTIKKILHTDLLPEHIFRTIIREPEKLTDIIKDCLECNICPGSFKDINKENISSICNKNNCFYLTGKNQTECDKIKTPPDYSLKEGELWDIYIVSKWSKERFLELLTFTGMNGYGRGSSIGKGQFVIKHFIELSREERLDDYSGEENGFMTLSSYIPLAGEIGDIEKSRYKLLIKVGKLGGHYASMENFFKYPVVMCRRGSIFPASPGTKTYWGGLIKGVHQEIEELVQYGIAFPVWGSFFEKR
jgi:CRISPR-associated protein Csm4